MKGFIQVGEKSTLGHLVAPFYIRKPKMFVMLKLAESLK